MEDEDRYTRITLRIPKDLHSRIAQAAESTSKSQNAEIVARLQASFEVPVVGVPVQTHFGGGGFDRTKDTVTDELDSLLGEYEALTALQHALVAEMDAVDGDVDAVAWKRLDFEVKTLASKERILKRRIEVAMSELQLFERSGESINHLAKRLKEIQGRLANEH